MPLDAEIYGRREALTSSLAGSAAMHAALLACVLFLPAVFSHSGDNWGNNGSGGASGEAMSAHLVSGIPLPPNPQAKPENVLANESKGLSQSLPTPKAKEDDQAIAIPDKQTKIVKPTKEKAATTAPSRENPRTLPKQPTVTTPTHEKPREIAKVDNTVPFGAGGPVAGPYTTFQSGSTAGGMKFGEGGNGSFGNRFGWYTDVVARKVHQAWQSEVNPSVSSAKRVYILFDIARSGKPSNVRVEQSSGIPALDISAVRTLQRIDTFGELPREYNGSYVSVEFWFDYRR
jgi:periplasmic protein TonB